MNFREMAAYYARETDRMTLNMFHGLISEGASRESAAEQAAHGGTIHGCRLRVRGLEAISYSRLHDRMREQKGYAYLRFPACRAPARSHFKTSTASGTPSA
jgi:hypothetical protein